MCEVCNSKAWGEALRGDDSSAHARGAPPPHSSAAAGGATCAWDDVRVKHFAFACAATALVAFAVFAVPAITRTQPHAGPSAAMEGDAG